MDVTGCAGQCTPAAGFGIAAGVPGDVVAGRAVVDGNAVGTDGDAEAWDDVLGADVLGADDLMAVLEADHLRTRPG